MLPKGFVPLATTRSNGHRAERRGRRHEHGGLPLGPSRRHDRASVDGLVHPADDKVVRFAKLPSTLDEIVASRVKHLTATRTRVARRYQALVEQVRTAEQKTGNAGLAVAVARNYASCWPTRTSTKWRDSMPRRPSKLRSVSSSRATTN